MKKNHKFDEKSTKVCDVNGCTSMIKARLLDADDHGGKGDPANAGKCYRCYSTLKRSEMTHSQIIMFKTNKKHINALRWQLGMDKTPVLEDAKA